MGLQVENEWKIVRRSPTNIPNQPVLMPKIPVRISEKPGRLLISSANFSLESHNYLAIPWQCF